MRSCATWLLLGAMTGGLAGLSGCVVRAHPAEVDVGPAVPAGVYYEEPYYYDGWYDGPYWVWRDRGGHYWHERREFHERRERGYRR